MHQIYRNPTNIYKKKPWSGCKNHPFFLWIFFAPKYDALKKTFSAVSDLTICRWHIGLWACCGYLTTLRLSHQVAAINKFKLDRSFPPFRFMLLCPHILLFENSPPPPLSLSPFLLSQSTLGQILIIKKSFFLNFFFIATYTRHIQIFDRAGRC